MQNGWMRIGCVVGCGRSYIVNGMIIGCVVGCVRLFWCEVGCGGWEHSTKNLMRVGCVHNLASTPNFTSKKGIVYCEIECGTKKHEKVTRAD